MFVNVFNFLNIFFNNKFFNIFVCIIRFKLCFIFRYNKRLKYNKFEFSRNIDFDVLNMVSIYFILIGLCIKNLWFRKRW